MQIIERGHGDPLVIVPGIQGRWEWHGAAIEALAERFRVITFSLGDEPAARCPSLRPGFDGFADQIEAALDDRQLSKAAVCGISFGGLVALRYAARAPHRVTSLVMVSVPGPYWHLKDRHDRYAQWPTLFAPFFAVEACGRMLAEIAATFPSRRDRLSFLARHLGTVVTAPGSARRMAARARSIAAYDRLADCGKVECPTLVMHGEPALDHVVNAAGTGEYQTAINGAAAATLAQTGHLGFATRPAEFARLVGEFVDSQHGRDATGSPVAAAPQAATLHLVSSQQSISRFSDSSTSRLNGGYAKS
jgi:pimeloyl-ACP methyl ester carboxylesterase